MECEAKWTLGSIAAAAVKSLQSCLTLCNAIDGSPPGSPIPGFLQVRTLEWVAIAFSIGSITMNKSSEDDGIPAELFQILKDDAVKSAALNMPATLEIQQCPKDWKRSVFIPIPKKGNAKECSNYHTVALILHASKVMLKILQVRLQQYMHHELPDVQAGFRKARGTRDQIANIRWIIEKAREFQKNIYFCFIDYAKAFDSVDHNKL